MARIEQFAWPFRQKLSEHYILEFERVSRFFEYNPWQEEEFGGRLQWLDESGSTRVERDRLVAALLHYNNRTEAPERTLHNIERLRSPQASVVIGGQQAGLFTGPLYCIHKAVTIIQTAARMEKRWNRPVIPVFWIAGEDHDFDEVNHCHVLSRENTLEKLTLPLEPSGRSPISRLEVDSAVWKEIIDALQDTLADTEFKPDIVARLRRFAERSASLSDFFARMMHWLFESYGLVMIDADDPRLRALETAMFERMIDEHLELNRSLMEATQALSGQGYAPQAAVGEQNVNLFYIDQGERILLRSDGERFTDKKGELSFDKDELVGMAKSDPLRFSNNVFTRPLMQDYVFPVLCTVLGQGEIAYSAQTRSAFAQLGLKQPIIVPRMEITLVEGTVQKQMNKFAISFEDAALRFEDWRQQWLAAQDSYHLEDRFAEVKRQFADLYSPLLKLVGEINPGMSKMGAANLQKVLEQVDFLQHRAVDAFQSQYEASLRQLDRVKTTIVPMEKPQDRVYNVLVYINRYGLDWLNALLEAALEPNGKHKIVYL